MVDYPLQGEHIGSFRVEEEIGHGGMGTVYRATQVGLDRPVALKILDPRLAGDPIFVERFHREAAALAILDSPHVIQIFDHGDVDGRLYLATQYVAGGDLNQLIRASGPLCPQIALQIVDQVLAALGDAHARGIIHRDVKPSNILLRAATSEPFAYLCDFGIARSDQAGLTHTGLIAGSWAYLSPERQSGQPGSAASDIYSAACVLWFLLTGRGVYTGTDVEIAMAHRDAPVGQLQGVDPLIVEVNRFFRACLDKDPAARPVSCAEARTLLARCLPLAEGATPLDLNDPDSGIFRTTGGNRATRDHDSAIDGPALTPAPGPSFAFDDAEVEANAAEPPAADHPRRTRRWVAVAGVAVAAAAVAIGSLLLKPTPTPAAPVVASLTGYRCWDGASVTSLSECTAPSGRDGLRFLYPSLNAAWTQCEYVPYRKTTDAYDCKSDGQGLIRYRYWKDAEEADTHYAKKYAKAGQTDLVLDGHVVGTIYRLATKTEDGYVMSGHWLDGHFSFSVEAPTTARRDELFRTIQLRAFDQLHGLAQNDNDRVGVLD